LYGVLADYSSIKNLDISVPEYTSISGFLEYMIAYFPETFNTQWMLPQEKHSLIKVFRNGELITPEIEQQWVKEGDDIRLFSAISGG
jgi:hypothetical protein